MQGWPISAKLCHLKDVSTLPSEALDGSGAFAVHLRLLVVTEPEDSRLGDSCRKQKHQQMVLLADTPEHSAASAKGLLATNTVTTEALLARQRKRASQLSFSSEVIQDPTS